MAKNGNNTRNPAAPLFKRLTRMLSGPIVNYRTQVARQEKRADLDKYRYRFRSMSGQEFKRHDSNMSQNFNLFTSAAFRNQNRAERYIDFEQMEYMPEIASALDIYADEMTTSNEYDRLLNIDCLNHEIKTILESLFYDVLNVEFNCFGWARSMCKYGDFFLYLDIDERLGIQSTVGLPTHEIERLEGEDKTNPKYIQFQWNSGGLTFENFQIGHFRILGNDKYAPYGTSILEASRRIWRQLSLLEDAMMAYRVVRSPERRIFYIDVGNLPKTKAEQYIRSLMQRYRNKLVYDVSTGEIRDDKKHMSMLEDYWLPRREGGKGAEISTLDGGQNLGEMDDVEYFQKKVYQALNVPLSRMETEDQFSLGRATEITRDELKFQRFVDRLRNKFNGLFLTLLKTQCLLKGIMSEEEWVELEPDINFDYVSDNHFSELKEYEILSERMNVLGEVDEYIGKYFSVDWVRRHILRQGDEEIDEMDKQISKEREAGIITDNPEGY